MRHGSYVRVEKRICLSAIVLSGILALAVAQQSLAQIQTIATATNPSSYSTQRLQNANHCLNAWLVKTGQGQRWRNALMLNILETQSAKGEQADIATLSQIHSRFCSGAMELQQPAFVNVRVALEHHIENLSTSRIGDIFAALTVARGQYHPISIAEMELQRDLAKQSLQSLKDYYLMTVPEIDRADLFADLKLDEAIGFLGTIEFELAPELSVGKMTSTIRGVEAELLKVTRAIDALPFETEPDGTEESQPEKPVDQDNPQQESEKTDAQEQQEETGPTRDELEKQRKELEARIAELKKQRSEINRLDRPRQANRRTTFNQLRKFKDNFDKLAESQGDPFFFSAQLDLDRFIQTYGWGTSDNLEENFLSRLELLEADLLEIDGPDWRASAGKVGDHLRWMENANQIPNLVIAIRARYSKPNGFVSVSSRFLNQIGAQSVSESQCVRETMDGRLVKGTLHTTANVAIDLQNDPNQVHASIHLTGNMHASTYIDQGKIRAFASTAGQLEGRRSLYANVGGLHAGSPKVAANIQAFFNGTSSSCRLINRIATKKFNEVKRKTEGTTARKAEDELLRKFADQTNEAIDKGSKQLLEAQDQFIPITNMLPEAYLRSFPSEIMIIAKKASIASLGAQKLPNGHQMPSDVLIRVHDSMPSNFLDKMFSGKTFTNEELAQELSEITGEAPDTLTDKPGADQSESFSITFANVRPIQIEFEDNRFRVVVSGRSFSREDTQINEALKIILAFKIASIDGKLKLVRDGDAEIDYLEPDKKRPATVAFRSFLIGKLNPKDNAEELSADLPDNLLPIDEVEQLQESEIAKELFLTQCRIENGWAYLAWNRRKSTDQSSMLLDTPAIWNRNSTSQVQPPLNQPSRPIVNQVENPAPIVVAAKDFAPIVVAAREPAPIVVEAKESAPDVVKALSPAPILVSAEEFAPIVVVAQEPTPIIVSLNDQKAETRQEGITSPDVQ